MRVIRCKLTTDMGESKIRQIISHTFIYGISPYIISLVSLFTMPILTSHLTADDYGIYGTITAYSLLLGGIASLGLTMLLTNSFYKNPNYYKYKWREIYGILSIWYVIYAFIMAGIIYYCIPQDAINNTFEIIIFSTLPVILFGPTASIGTLYFQLNKKPFQLLIRNIIAGILTIVINLFTIAYLELGYMGWFWSGFIVGVLMNFSYFIPLYQNGIKPIYKINWQRLKNMLKITIPTIPHYYANYMLTGATKVVMNQLHVPLNNIGKYNMAEAFGGYIGNIANASNTAIGPFLLELYSKNKFREARDLVFVWQGIFLCLTFSCSLILKEVFYFLIRNEELREVYPLAIIMIMAYNYRPMYVGCNQIRFYYEKTKSLWKISFMAGVINICLNIILIPFFGYKIIPIVFFISMMYWGYSGFFNKDYKELMPIRFYPLFWFILTLILTIVAYLLANIHISIRIIILCMSILISILLFIKIKKYIHVN